ncbi:MAG TPA: YXWGXW repeat-containing protein [Gemmatimonadales bacterium]|jgi:hypothetical protein|nr:YXWGXW repeat-containing protein [Gemmatimonadales bacterium]
MSRMTDIRRGLVAAAVLATASTVACAPLPPSGVVIVARRPPGAQREVIGVAPGQGYVWIGGHWGWQANDYVWVAGRWEAPPRPRARWSPGHWVHGRGGYYWVEGRWI